RLPSQEPQYTTPPTTSGCALADRPPCAVQLTASEPALPVVSADSPELNPAPALSAWYWVQSEDPAAAMALRPVAAKVPPASAAVTRAAEAGFLQPEMFTEVASKCARGERRGAVEFRWAPHRSGWPVGDRR